MRPRNCKFWKRSRTKGKLGHRRASHMSFAECELQNQRAVIQFNHQQKPYIGCIIFTAYGSSTKNSPEEDEADRNITLNSFSKSSGDARLGGTHLQSQLLGKIRQEEDPKSEASLANLFQNKIKRAGNTAQYLPSWHKALSSILNTRRGGKKKIHLSQAQGHKYTNTLDSFPTCSP